MENGRGEGRWGGQPAGSELGRGGRGKKCVGPASGVAGRVLSRAVGCSQRVRGEREQRRGRAGLKKTPVVLSVGLPPCSLGAPRRPEKPTSGHGASKLGAARGQTATAGRRPTQCSPPR